MGVTVALTCGFISFKSTDTDADRVNMMITTKQARLAAEDLRERRVRAEAAHHGISLELLIAARDAVENAPDTRPERVQVAMSHLDAGVPDCHEVAQMMISRIISDSLR